TGEIGIRAAPGVSKGNLLGLILRDGLWMMLSGLVIGLAGALGFAKLLSAFLFGITAIGLLACYIPARRAARVDPAIALRYE
ncbi:MAG: ABC transporter permease, partial [Bryobacteraceae bacterium]